MVSLWFSDLFKGFIGVKESRVQIRGADFTMRKEVYGRNFLYHCNSTTWTLCVEAHFMVYDGQGLGF